MNRIIYRLIRKAEGEYSYDNLIQASDDDLIKKLNNAQAINGTWASLDNTQKTDLAQRIIQLFKDNKSKILSLYEHLEQGQAAAQKTLFNTMNISDKLDKECFQELKSIADPNDDTANVADKVNTWVKEHTNTTINEFQKFIESLNVSKNDIIQAFNRAVQDGTMVKKDADAIVQGLNKINI